MKPSNTKKNKKYFKIKLGNFLHQSTLLAFLKAPGNGQPILAMQRTLELFDSPSGAQGRSKMSHFVKLFYGL